MASSILEWIQKFFDNANFQIKPEKIREHVCWALRPDGPVYYASPTPQARKVDRSHADYIVSFTLHITSG
jgi:hypothetical protein